MDSYMVFAQMNDGEMWFCDKYRRLDALQNEISTQYRLRTNKSINQAEHSIHHVRC